MVENYSISHTIKVRLNRKDQNTFNNVTRLKEKEKEKENLKLFYYYILHLSFIARKCQNAPTKWEKIKFNLPNRLCNLKNYFSFI
jgi:hypothetical protein